MSDVDAVVEDGRFAEDDILLTDLVALFGIFAAWEPDEIGDACAIGEVGDDTLLPRSCLEGLEAEDVSLDRKSVV